MKMLSQTAGLQKLRQLKDEFRSTVASEYEQKAKPCSACSTPGACCLDAHFVNVRISKLEAAAITKALASLSAQQRSKVSRRVDDVIRRFGLDDNSDAPAKTYACPLFEVGVGCLVHDTAKPLPCIHHACYENKADLPPDDLLESAELAVNRLNKKVYGRPLTLLPLPIAVREAESLS